MCWPPGKADRRYAGVTHLDVSDFTRDRAAEVRELLRIHGVRVSGLGYYPNPLDPDPEHRARVADHIRKLVRAAPMIGVNVVNTFIGRDPAKPMSKSLAEVADVWAPLVREAAAAGVRVGIEHCPMLFTEDEWPGGKNLATTPAVWRDLFGTFDAISPGTVGLNFDPSHLVWQFVDCGRAVREFGARLVHVHAKDEHRPRPAVRGGGARPRLARPEAAGTRRRELGRVLRRPHRRRVQRPGVRRGRGPSLRGLARRPPAGAAAEPELPQPLLRVIVVGPFPTGQPRARPRSAAARGLVFIAG